jgi:hypothetical protein
MPLGLAAHSADGSIHFVCMDWSGPSRDWIKVKRSRGTAGKDAHEGRGATDRHQHRAAA